ncbi:MAG: DNA pilot protein [Microviridae sp.]|nr:MAG: DNA pilot protein [Microviridae sp.]
MPILLPLMLAGTALSTASRFLANRQASKVAERNTNLTIAENKKLSELAYQRDQQQVSEMNKYNSPKEQMKRFGDAGLNPNLIYQQGNSGNQSQLARYSAPNLAYNYQQKFKGNEFDSFKDLPLMYSQVKNQLAVGSINEAKATMERALSKYSDLIAKNKHVGLYNSAELGSFKRVFAEEEFNRFFYETSQGYVLRSGMEETFVNNLVGKWVTPITNLEKTQKDMAIKDQLLKNL